MVKLMGLGGDSGFGGRLWQQSWRGDDESSGSNCDSKLWGAMMVMKAGYLMRMKMEELKD